MNNIPTRDTPRSPTGTEPILTYEKSLTSKIAKGSAARDVLDQEIAHLGGQLVANLHALFKTSRIHDRNNTALNQPVQIIMTLIATLAQDKKVTIRLQNDFLFLDDMHLKMTTQQFTTFMEFSESLNIRGIGSLAFDSSLQENDLREFAHLFVTMDPADETITDLQRRMEASGLKGIEIEESKHIRLKVGDRNEHAKTLARNTYVKAAEAVGEVVNQTKEGKPPNFKRAKRIIQNIVDLMAQDENFLLSLTTLRCYDQYTHNHSVNVALLSLSLANRCRFPKPALADLGLAALLHDMGKASIPVEVLNKPGEFTQEEWQMMRRHPAEGVLDMVRLRGLDHLPGRMAAASFEHHMNYNLSGYPKLAVPWTLTLTGRIVMIADCYDAMTSSRVYRREPWPPEKVLKFMLEKKGELFDQTLLKLFVNCVGIIPIGSLVLLDTNELAVVLRPARDQKDMERPIVKLITTTSGDTVDGPEVDLTETDANGHYMRSVAQIVDNTEYRFDTSRYFS
jgi:HD-GYP domain-containing protein (c-di-GMP phosphodiesterase class II)